VLASRHVEMASTMECKCVMMEIKMEVTAALINASLKKTINALVDIRIRRIAAHTFPQRL
jgi:hypothetical protein